MVKHTQAIRRLLPTNCLSLFDHFVGLALKGVIQDANHIKKKLFYVSEAATGGVL